MSDTSENELELWALVGAKLGEARRALHLSKREAARRAGFSEGQWRDMEKGHRSPIQGVAVPMNPRDDVLAGAARAVGLDVGELFAMAGRTPPPDLPATKSDALRALDAAIVALGQVRDHLTEHP